MRVSSLVPNLMVEDVNRSVEWYVSMGRSYRLWVTLEKETLMGYTSEQKIIYAQLTMGDVEIMVEERSEFEHNLEHVDNGQSTWWSLTFYLRMVEWFEEMYSRVKWTDALVKDVAMTWYGMKEFYVRDLDGYVWCYGEGEDNG